MPITEKLRIIGLIFGALIVIAIAAIAALLLRARHRFGRAKDTRDLQARIDRIGNDYIGKRNGVGLIVGVVKNGQTYVKGFGKINKQSDQAPTAETLFELASVGKLFTAATAQIMHDNNELSLDDTLDKHLGARIRLCEAAKNATLRQLAAHVSGFPPLPASFERKMIDEANPYKDLRVEDLHEYLRACEGKQPAGNYRYSNLGMGILGYVLALKTGKTYEETVRERLLKPLEMNATIIELSDAQRQQVAQGYNEAGAPNPIWEDQVLPGAGSFLSNADDALKFLCANLNDSGSRISKSLARTHEPQFGGKTGLGWHRQTRLERWLFDAEVLWHNGAAGGYSSFAAIDKNSNAAIVLLSNSTNDVTTIGLRAIQIVRKISLAEH